LAIAPPKLQAATSSALGSLRAASVGTTIGRSGTAGRRQAFHGTVMRFEAPVMLARVARTADPDLSSTTQTSPASVERSRPVSRTPPPGSANASSSWNAKRVGGPLKSWPRTLSSPCAVAPQAASTPAASRPNVRRVRRVRWVHRTLSSAERSRVTGDITGVVRSQPGGSSAAAII
jgi:hypothetical protein